VLEDERSRRVKQATDNPPPQSIDDVASAIVMSQQAEKWPCCRVISGFVPQDNA
jgi:hypothetical protein